MARRREKLFANSPPRMGAIFRPADRDRRSGHQTPRNDLPSGEWAPGPRHLCRRDGPYFDPSWQVLAKHGASPLDRRRGSHRRSGRTGNGFGRPAPIASSGEQMFDRQALSSRANLADQRRATGRPETVPTSSNQESGQIGHLPATPPTPAPSRSPPRWRGAPSRIYQRRDLVGLVLPRHVCPPVLFQAAALGGPPGGASLCRRGPAAVRA